MWRRVFLLGTIGWTTILLLASGLSSVKAELVVVGHPSLPAVDSTTLARVYTGRTSQLQGQAVRPINLKSGDPRRDSFVTAVLQQSDDDYIAYWIVRRAIGRGTPPPELADAAAVLAFVRNTPGGLGYVDGAEVGAEDHILLRLP